MSAEQTLVPHILCLDCGEDGEKGSPGVTVSLAQTGCHPRHEVVGRVLDCSQSPEPSFQVRHLADQKLNPVI